MEGEKTCVCFFFSNNENFGRKLLIRHKENSRIRVKKYGFTNPVFSCFKHLQEKRRATSSCCFPCKKVVVVMEY